jgi:D-xylose transport system ATP-binding protein
MTMPSATATAPPLGDQQPILSLRKVNKSFGAVHVLQDVDFDAFPGQVTALVGDNGAGKSTLIKGIAGSQLFDSGDYLFEGKPVAVHSPKDANALGIEVVYQDLALCDNLDIVHNLFLGRELTKRGVLDEATMEKRATETLAGLSVRTVRSIRQQVASLSGGQRQTVAIARSVLWNSRVVVLDEPTAALGVAQTEQVLRLVRRLADRGLAVVLISHNLNDVFAVADTISVLYLGRMAAQVKAKDVTSNQVVELITTSRSGSLGLSADVEPGVTELRQGMAADGGLADSHAATGSPAAATREDTP